MCSGRNRSWSGLIRYLALLLSIRAPACMSNIMLHAAEHVIRLWLVIMSRPSLGQAAGPVASIDQRGRGARGGGGGGGGWVQPP